MNWVSNKCITEVQMKSCVSNPCVSHILQITMYVLSFFFLELSSGRVIDNRVEILIFDVVDV